MARTFKLVCFLASLTFLVSAAPKFHQDHQQGMKREFTRTEKELASLLKQMKRTSDPCVYACPNPPTQSEQTVCVDAYGDIFEVSECFAGCRGYSIVNYGSCDNVIGDPRDFHHMTHGRSFQALKQGKVERKPVDRLNAKKRTSDPCVYACPNPPPQSEQTVCVDAYGDIFEVSECFAGCRGYTIVTYGSCDNVIGGPRDFRLKNYERRNHFRSPKQGSAVIL